MRKNSSPGGEEFRNSRRSHPQSSRRQPAAVRRRSQWCAAPGRVLPPLCPREFPRAGEKRNGRAGKWLKL